MAAYKVVGKSMRKKDSMQLLLGKPLFVDDITPQDALVTLRCRLWWKCWRVALSSFK